MIFAEPNAASSKRLDQIELFDYIVVHLLWEGSVTFIGRVIQEVVKGPECALNRIKVLALGQSHNNRLDEATFQQSFGEQIPGRNTIECQVANYQPNWPHIILK